MIDIDQEAIRKKVENRTHTLNINELWMTPAGNHRSVPMYEVFIKNDYLGKSRNIKKGSLNELEIIAADQLSKWDDQEIRKRIKDAKNNAKDKAEAEWLEMKGNLKDNLNELENILYSTVNFDDKINWEDLLDHTEYHEFKFENIKPLEPAKPKKPIPPKKTLFDSLVPFLWRKKEDEYNSQVERLKIHSKNLALQYKKDLDLWNGQKAIAHKDWLTKKAAFNDARDKRNQTILQFKKDFESGELTAILEYFEAVFERSTYPENFNLKYSLNYETNTKTLLVDLSLPSQDELPQEADFRLKKTSGEITPVFMKQKEHDALYDSVIQQTVIRTIHEVFESDYVNLVLQVVINGWVTYLDKATGNDKTSCIISVSADREEFEDFNLERLDPSECIKSLKGVVAGPLSNVAPVKPILQLDKNDRRFIESEEILAELNSTTNLAEIGWEEFEHLVRELFEQMFSNETSEVKVTQASSDGGIDAIAFDSDPIRGGKFVIQAKRYTKVVPVSAVRDLYGTMISEGATKGILVTTAHFGRDTRSFVKNKPITLIDGSNLVYLLEEHGHQVRIDVKAARAKMKSN